VQETISRRSIRNYDVTMTTVIHTGIIAYLSISRNPFSQESDTMILSEYIFRLLNRHHQLNYIFYLFCFYSLHLLGVLSFSISIAKRSQKNCILLPES